MANEGARTSFDINQAVSEAVASAMSSITESISSVIDTRLQAFKEENSQTVEAAVKRARHDRYEFKSKGNKQQYEHDPTIDQMRRQRLPISKEQTNLLHRCSSVAASHIGALTEC